MPNPTLSIDDLIAQAIRETARAHAARLRELHGELGLVVGDNLTTDQRDYLGIVLHGLWQLAQEMEGEHGSSHP